MEEGATQRPEDRGGLALAGVLFLTLAVRMIAPEQPIVENYVGRQVPTAMVARNLERGSGFLDPRLDVAPFPNRFLVEPPLYATAAVTFRKATGCSLVASGRLVSAFGIVLATWGLHGLVAARSGRVAALLAAAALAAFPVTIRYGRAFQPDALMLGTLVSGLCCWDRFEREGRRGWLVAGFLLTATGLALKVLSVFVLVPLWLVIIRKHRAWKTALVVATLVPALLWYIHAASVLSVLEGSRASADNGAIWLRALDPRALLRRETLGHVAWFLGVRAFTPLGPPLALAGLLLIDRAAPDRRLWLAWGASGLAAMAVVASKLHHEYYWLVLAPAVAAGVGRALAALARQGMRGRAAAVTLGLLLIVLDAGFSASTWRTPVEWRSLDRAAAAVRQGVPADAWIAAPEALLFAADRRGCRIEFTTPAARRAASEWAAQGLAAEAAAVDGPVALLEFYRRRGARYFADVTPEGAETSRLALHEAVRSRYNVLIDRAGLLLAALDALDHGVTRPDHASRAR